MNTSLNKSALNALCVALARSRGAKGYTSEDSAKLACWANGIIRKAEELREVVQGTRGVLLGQDIATFPLEISRERQGRRKGLVADCIDAPPAPEKQVMVVQGPKKKKGPTGSQFTPLVLGGGKYLMMAKPGSLYDTTLTVCDKACRLAESGGLFEQFREKKITAASLAAFITISIDRLCEMIETSPKYAAYMQRIGVLASGGSIRASRKLGRSLKERLLEVTYLLAESSAYSTAQPRNAWRLRKAGLVFLKATVNGPRNSFYSLFPAEYEDDYHRMLGEIGATISLQKQRLVAEAKK